MNNYQLSEETIIRIYAGWLGKIIGIRLGAPVESWSAEKIAEVYGEIWDYPVDYGIFAADDDSNGPLFFVRALKDSQKGKDLRAEEVAGALLNYAPYEHGFFWWGGYGVSTEHTAYRNLRNGIPAPVSGSIRKNGAVIAEQIGGQIFIDPWGLAAPGNPGLAARLAREAASVTHDGNGIYGGIFIASCISLAFTECSILEMIEGALAYIPEDSEYAKMVRAVTGFYSGDPSADWRAAFQFVKENYGYDRYPGWCHIIPNAAVVVLALLYGGDDFARTLCIGNMCGWDTDCNVGNLGTIMGVRRGLSGIDYDRWRKPISDLLLCSSVMGSLNITDIPYGAMYMAECAFALAGQELPGHWRELKTDQVERCHFEFPGSTHAMQVRCEAHPDTPHLEYVLRNTDEASASGKRSLRMYAWPLKCGQKLFLYQRTWFTHEQLHDDRYQPAFSPKIYPGQSIRAVVMLPEGRQALKASLYVRELRGDTVYCGAETLLVPGRWMELAWKIPPMQGALLSEAGLQFTVPGDSDQQQELEVYLDGLEYGGDPSYHIDFQKERELELPMSHYEITQFTKLKGWTFLENGALHLTSEDFGETYTGSFLFRDYEVTAELEPLYGGGHFVNVRVQGGQRSYAAGFDKRGRLGLWKNEGGYRELASVPFAWKYRERYVLTVRAVGNRISVIHAKTGETLLACTDQEAPYLQGSVGLSVRDAGHLAVRNLSVEAVK